MRPCSSSREIARARISRSERSLKFLAMGRWENHITPEKKQKRKTQRTLRTRWALKNQKNLMFVVDLVFFVLKGFCLSVSPAPFQALLGRSPASARRSIR